MPATPDPALLDQLRSALAASYDIERELAGGMSRVFVATERALGRRVVLKVLPPELTAGVNRDRFRREIQFAARLQHPHIVPLLTAGQVGEILYYTMPLVEGETLRARLDRERRLPAATVVSILQDLVDALAYAHGQGLIHRDIKPENILLQRHHALVTDFGVAKAISEALPGTAATTVGVAVGTPAYMAPEQLAADPAADHRIDLYAVGLVAYELLSGESPFSGSSPQQTLARQLTERPTPPHLRRTDVPPALSAAIMRCLEKEPAARYATADELLQAIAAIRITASGMAAMSRTMRLPASKPASRSLLVVVGSLALVGAIAAGGYALWKSGDPMVSAGVPAAAMDVTPVDTLAAPESLPARPGLTRADSEAIAAAVARQMPRREPAPVGGLTQPGLDSLRQQVARTVTDSLMRMLAPGRQTARGNAGTEGVPRPPGEPAAPQVIVRTMDARQPFRVALPRIADRSPDRSLGAIATAIGDSLTRFVGRRPAMRLVPEDTMRALVSSSSDVRWLGTLLGADAVVQGSVQPAGGDSLEVVFRLSEGHDPRYAKTIRHAVPAAESGSLAGIATSLVTAWLESRETSGRRARTLTIPATLSLDSAVRAAMRLKDSLRRTLPRPLKPQPDPEKE